MSDSSKILENLQKEGKTKEEIISLLENALKMAKAFKKEDFSLQTLILSCVQKFNFQYGKSGIAKILKGSKSLKDNGFNNLSINSEFFGKFSNLTLDSIKYEIDKLIEEKKLIVKKTAFGRPILGINGENKNNKEEISFNENKDDKLSKILKLIKNGENLFITGHAGTGKSYILNKLKEKIKNLVLTSTTGMAAVNIKGQTIHSFAGVGICNRPIEYTVQKILKRSKLKKQIQKCKILAVDEISMLDVKTFEYIDKVLRLVRDELSLPFGGIQTVFIGDFFQLPPVDNDNSSKKYCFESSIWDEFNFKNILLDKNYRQNEENFIKALFDMRVNSLNDEDIKLLKTREYKGKEDISDILHIFATNLEADNYNSFKFKGINSKEYVVLAQDGIYKGKKFVLEPENERDLNILKRVDSSCNAEKEIKLKIGARVMLLINLDFEAGLINGSSGEILDIDEDFVTVKFDNGVVSKIQRHDFEFYNNETLVAKRSQFPLRLAYGITIHKSQGMSLDKLVVDCSRIFEKGQAYVALSRIKTLDGLYLYNFNKSKVMVDNKVVDFYDNLNFI